MELKRFKENGCFLFYKTFVICIKHNRSLNLLKQLHNCFIQYKWVSENVYLKQEKNKGINQETLAEQLGTKGPAIGRYESDEMKPSIETAKKLAEALAVALDYLVGDGDLKVEDKKAMHRLEDIEKLPQEDKTYIFYTLDNSIKAAKYKAI